MLVKEIVERKDRKILSVPPETKVIDAIKFMEKYDIGSVMVLVDEKLVGIFTERDLLHLTATRKGDFLDHPISEVMSTSLTTLSADHDVDEVFSIMLNKRIRHLPITEGKDLVGIISIGDAVKAKVEKTEAENQNLKQYIFS